MLSYSFYESDGRVRRYAETLAQRGDEVDVIALGSQYPHNHCYHDVLKGVTFYRVQNRLANEKGKFSYLLRILKFFLKSSIILTKKHLKNSYQFIHVHNIPDFMVFAAVIPKLLGARIILDIHDIIPEFYTSKFNVSNNSFIVKGLLLLEKVSVAFADHVIISNHIWRETLTRRSVKEEKCTVMLNYPDSSIFYRRPRCRNDGKFIIIYPGTLNKHQGVDIAIRAFGHIKDRVADVEFHIYGGGGEKSSLNALISQLGLEDKVFVKNVLPLEQIVDRMADADLAIVPKRAESFGNEAFSTKIFEFMMLGIPVIVSNTKIDRYYFNDSVVKFFESGDENDLARCILLLIRDKERRKRFVANASKFIENYTWDKKKDDYLKLVDSLIGNSRGKAIPSSSLGT
jgi:glycosyltransferase involved in cell wall biosynthesis